MATNENNPGKLGKAVDKPRTNVGSATVKDGETVSLTLEQPPEADSTNAVGAEHDKTVDPTVVVEGLTTRVIVDSPIAITSPVPDGLDADAPRIGPYWSQKADNDKRSGTS